MNFRKIFKRLIIITGLGILFLFYCHLESRWIKTKNIELISGDIPGSFIGKKVVFITDIHHGPFLSIERVNKLVDRINRIEPDIILMGGDYVHRESKFIEPVLMHLKILKPSTEFMES